MKKNILTIAVMIAAITGVVAGPNLLDAYRLQEHISSAAKAYEANGGPWPHVADSCATCHGPNGNSANQWYPSLAAQRPEYLVEQIQNFFSGQRHFPMMNAMSRSLKEGDVESLSAFFARQKPIDNHYFEADEGLRQKGEKLVKSGACIACHGDALMGKDRFPRLAGQGYDYLLRQLNGFSVGTRRDPSGMMNQLSSSWSTDDRKAIATYLASHPVTVPENATAGDSKSIRN